MASQGERGGSGRRPAALASRLRVCCPLRAVPTRTSAITPFLRRLLARSARQGMRCRPGPGGRAAGRRTGRPPSHGPGSLGGVIGALVASAARQQVRQRKRHRRHRQRRAVVPGAGARRAAAAGHDPAPAQWPSSGCWRRWCCSRSTSTCGQRLGPAPGGLPDPKRPWPARCYRSPAPWRPEGQGAAPSRSRRTRQSASLLASSAARRRRHHRPTRPATHRPPSWASRRISWAWLRNSARCSSSICQRRCTSDGGQSSTRLPAASATPKAVVVTWRASASSSPSAGAGGWPRP